MLETLAVRAHEKGLELIGQIDPKIPELVDGDPFRLRQILTNLVGNAVKFTERGQVLIILQRDPASGRLRFEVRDTGVGIPKDKLESLFEPFSQADSSTTRRYGGTGLGLAIVARLVALMDGEIAVESTPGAGSVFRFSVRCEAPGNPISAQDPLPHFTGRKILVADDNSGNCEAICTILAHQGADVNIANSGTEAIELIRQMSRQSTPFDAIVVDPLFTRPDRRRQIQQMPHLILPLPEQRLWRQDQHGPGAVERHQHPRHR